MHYLCSNIIFHVIKAYDIGLFQFPESINYFCFLLEEKINCSELGTAGQLDYYLPYIREAFIKKKKKLYKRLQSGLTPPPIM